MAWSETPQAHSEQQNLQVPNHPTSLREMQAFHPDSNNNTKQYRDLSPVPGRQANPQSVARRGDADSWLENDPKEKKEPWVYRKCGSRKKFWLYFAFFMLLLIVFLVAVTVGTGKTKEKKGHGSKSKSGGKGGHH